MQKRDQNISNNSENLLFSFKKAALKVTEKKLLGERVERTVITIASLAKTTHESCVWGNNEE